MKTPKSPFLFLLPVLMLLLLLLLLLMLPPSNSFTNSFDHVGYEGMFLFKANRQYYPACAENFNGRYSCTIATSTNTYGPYGPRYEAIPHGGHNVFFQDDLGKWWSTYFGSDNSAPWQERPGILPVTFDAEGKVHGTVN